VFIKLDILEVINSTAYIDGVVEYLNLEKMHLQVIIVRFCSYLIIYI